MKIAFGNGLGCLGFFFGWGFFLRLKAGKTKVCQIASHRACFIQGVTNFIAFENFWA